MGRISKLIDCFDSGTGELLAVFPSAYKASEVTGINLTTISAICRGDLLQSNGYTFLYSEGNAKLVRPIKPIRKYTGNKKPVVAIDKTTKKVVAVFKSMGEAERSTGADIAVISKVANKVEGRKSAGGYIWLYKSEFMEVGIHG